jgi:hypothetical protein
MPGHTVRKLEWKLERSQTQVELSEQLNEKWLSSEILRYGRHHQKTIETIQSSSFLGESGSAVQDFCM